MFKSRWWVVSGKCSFLPKTNKQTNKNQSSPDWYYTFLLTVFWSEYKYGPGLSLVDVFLRAEVSRNCQFMATDGKRKKLWKYAVKKKNILLGCQPHRCLSLVPHCKGRLSVMLSIYKPDARNVSAMTKSNLGIKHPKPCCQLSYDLIRPK